MAGRFPNAIDQIKLAQAIDPVSPIITKDTGLIHYYAGEYDLALEECNKAIDLSPDFYPARAALGDIYLQLGRREEALAELRKANQLEGRLLTKAALGYGYRQPALGPAIRRSAAGHRPPPGELIRMFS